MANVASNWQESLDRRLVNRLTRPLHQPGMMKMTMSQGIINRCDRFLTRLPLLDQQMQRWGNIQHQGASDSVPIVYARPIPIVDNRVAEATAQNIQPATSPDLSSQTIIQRKIDSTQASSESNIPNKVASSLSSETQTEQAALPLTIAAPSVSGKDTTPIEQSAIAPLQKADPMTPPLPDMTTTSLSNKDGIQNTIAPQGMPIVTAQSTLQASSNPSESNISNEVAPSLSSETQTEQAALPLTIAAPSVSGKDKTPIEQSAIAPLQKADPMTPPSPDMTTTSLFNKDGIQNAIAPEEIPVVTAQSALKPLPETNRTLQPNSRASELKLPSGSTTTSMTAGNEATKQDAIAFREIPVITAQSVTEALPQDKAVLLVREKTTPSHHSSTGVVTKQSASFTKAIASLNRSAVSINKTTNSPSTSSLPLVTPKSSIDLRSQFQSVSLPLVQQVKPHQPSTKNNSFSNLERQNSTTQNMTSSTKIYASAFPPTQTTASKKTESKIDLEAITNKVERKIMRRLVVESERRGKR